MTPRSCSAFQSLFSAYLDGAVSGRGMQSIASHLKGCAGCCREFEGLRAMQESLSALRSVKAPADLGMKLRLAISHERARSKSSWVDGFRLKWDNAVRPMVLQVSAGFAGTVVLVGGIMLLLGMVAAPEPVMANDEPLGALTAPHYLYSAVMPRAIVTGHDTTIVVEALVNSRGQVYDFNIVSGPEDQAVQIEITDQLLQSVFEPARVFGGPIRGRVVITFAGISVQG